MIGRTIGHFQILDRLGQGGMGEVYLAEDLSLGRRVALKFLTPGLQQDTTAQERLVREARAAAALDHPHICHIHEVGQADGNDFIVMEYVEGRMLSSRLAEGPLSIREALQKATEIAEALEQAHEKGIVHRDLKPANIMLTPKGHIKVMDFGLAKRVVGSGEETSPEKTLTALTRGEGTPGTLAYMSPEQLRGQSVDGRSDIFSFGIILYEMLTGAHPFRKKSLMDTASSILNESTPSLSSRVAGVPVILQHIIRKMLAKDPDRRYQSVHELRTDLMEVLEQEAGRVTEIGGVPPDVAPAVTKASPTKRLWIYASILILSTAAISALTTRWIYHNAPVPATEPVRSVIKLQPGYQLAGWIDERQGPTSTAMALSSDGRFVVYSAIPTSRGPGSKSQLYLRTLDQLEARPIAGTEGGECPFLSPDGRWVGFYVDAKLMKAPIAGGTPVILCEMPKFFGASWSEDDRIVFSPNHNVGLSSISAEGGKPAQLTAPEAGRDEYSHRLPSWLPDGRGILFTIVRQMHDMQPRIAVLPRNSREWRVILENAADARYVPDGHLVFARRGVLMAVRFDLEKLEVTGQPAPVLSDVMQALNVEYSMQHTAAAQYCFSRAGGLIYVPGGILADSSNSIVWVDQKGGAREILAEKKPYFAPRLSPDGRQIVYQTLGEEKCVWIYDLERGISTRLTTEGVAALPIWTPDQKQITFGWTASGERNLFEQLADGSGPMKRLTTARYDQFPGSWTSNDELLALVESTEDDHNILFYRPKDRKIVPFLNTRFKERQPDFSPNGSWLAYTSDESGRDEIHVRPVGHSGGRVQISTAGGTEPLWARDGKRLFYRRGDQIWAVDIRWEPAFSPAKPQLLFEGPHYSWAVNIRGYDISLDGQRFLMVKEASLDPHPVTEIILVQNWFAELKRMVAVKRP
jgi:serine/threonine-protein kinase